MLNQQKKLLIMSSTVKLKCWKSNSRTKRYSLLKIRTRFSSRYFSLKMLQNFFFFKISHSGKSNNLQIYLYLPCCSLKFLRFKNSKIQHILIMIFRLEMTNGTYQPAGILETLYGGVDMTHINDGGIECLKQGNSLQARIIETLVGDNSIKIIEC